MKKLYLLFLLTILALVAYGQTSKTINVETAGTLPTLISEDEKYTIEELTLTGNLNGTDFRLLRDMAGNDYQGKVTQGKLKVLDINGANIVAGGDVILDANRIEFEGGSFGYGDEYKKTVYIVKDNVIPSDIFKCCKVESVKLPKTLIELETDAFADCIYLKSISFGENITTIGWNAFYECTNLSTIIVAEGNQKYDSRDNCNAIIESATNTLVRGCNGTVIPNTITSIGSSAFSYCAHLGDIVIPKSVTSIDHQAFYRYCGVTSVTVEAGNPVFDSRNNCNAIIETATNTLYRGFECSTIPADVTSVGDNAFYGCLGLESIIIPDNIKTIGGFAFNGCGDLKSIIIPNSVTEIGGYVFINSKVSHVKIPSSVTSIGTYAFSDIPFIEVERTTPMAVTEDVFKARERQYLIVPQGYKSVYAEADYWKEFKMILEGPFPDGNIDFADSNVKSICTSQWEWDANHDMELSYMEAATVTSLGDVFQNKNYISSFDELQYFISLSSIEALNFGACNKMTSVIIPRNVNTIKTSAFAGCSSLISLVIPANVTSIEKSAFSDCSGLTSVIVDEANLVYDSRNECNAIIETASNELILGCKNTHIPDNVKSIGYGAFLNCIGLERVKIPENISEIQADAFNGCSQLMSIEIPSSVCAIGEKAFYECKMLSAIISNVKEPFAINENVFALSDGFSNATLYVPEGSVGLYEASDSWNKFKEIKAIEPYVEPSTIQETPLTFEAVEGTVKVSFYNGWDIMGFPIKYRIDDGPWIDGYIDDYGCPATSQFIGKKLQFKTKFVNTGSRQSVRISCDNDCYIYGNILSMTQGDDFATTKESGACGSLFYGNTHIKNHPTKDLVLPATSLENRCYLQLFRGCTGLTKAPELPATIMKGSCYSGMFIGCTSLTVAPELPATILESYCYDGMFRGCSNLNEVVCKAIDISAEGSTTNWLDGVSATGTFYKDATMTDWTEGVNGIPTGWTVKDFNTKVEKDDVVYTPNDEDHTVTVSDGGDSSTEIVIQSSISINGQSYEVTAIGDCAFQNNELVVKVTIPETIASIGTKAFAGCKNLKSICIYVKVPINLFGAAASKTRGDGGSSVFSGVDTETCVLYVPAGSGDAYRNADGWKEFTNIVEMASSIGIKVAKGMTTYTSEHNLDFSSLGDDVKAYVATGYDYDKNTIWLTRVKDVPAGTPILVQAPASDTPYDIPVKASSGCYYKNMLVGNLSGAEITLSATTGDMTNYYLSNGMFLTATGSNTIGNGKAYLQIPTTPPAANVGSSQSVTLNDYGFASFCGSQDLDFTDVDGLKAFAVTGYDDANGTIWLTRVKRVSAKTPLLLKGDSKGSYSVPSVAVGSYYANMMKGNLSGSTITIFTTDGDMTNYYLKGNQLLKATDGGNTIGNGKAYMQIPSKHVTRSIEDIVTNLLIYGISDDEPEVISIPVVSARGINGDGMTGIHTIENGKLKMEKDVYYNLQGQRVENPTKGVYIKDGKKVLIK